MWTKNQTALKVIEMLDLWNVFLGYTWVTIFQKIIPLLTNPVWTTANRSIIKPY